MDSVVPNFSATWSILQLSGLFRSCTQYPSEMRGYRCLISTSYPYPFKTIRIRILSVQMSLTAIRILTVSVVLSMARWHRESPTLFVTSFLIWIGLAPWQEHLLYTTYSTRPKLSSNNKNPPDAGMGNRTGWIESMSSAPHSHSIWSRDHRPATRRFFGCILHSDRAKSEQNRSSRSRVMCVDFPKIWAFAPSPNMWSRDPRLDFATGFASWAALEISFRGGRAGQGRGQGGQAYRPCRAHQCHSGTDWGAAGGSARAWGQLPSCPPLKPPMFRIWSDTDSMFSVNC